MNRLLVVGLFMEIGHERSAEQDAARDALSQAIERATALSTPALAADAERLCGGP